MATLAAFLRSVNWAGHLQVAWTRIKGVSTSGIAYLASLPPTCVLASAHAALVCSGEPPEYGTPGFGPLAANWGWLLVGFAAGVQVTVLVVLLMARSRNDIYAPALATIAGVNAASSMGTLQHSAEPSEEVLHVLATGGKPALQTLAARTGLTEAELIRKVFGASPAQSTTGLLPQQSLLQRSRGAYVL